MLLTLITHQPQALAALAHDMGLALGVAALYGLFNGVLAARALRLWRIPARTALPV